MKNICLLLCSICTFVLLLPTSGQAQGGEHRAGLVVRFGDGRVVNTCVHFSEESISGEDLLARSGLPFIVQPSGLGAAVCKIGPEGCDYPAEDCFCKCKGADCAYWAFQRQVDGAWRYSNQGISTVPVRDGDVHGWAWGAGSVQSGAVPPLLTLAQLCDVAPVVQAPTAAPSPTSAPAPTARPTRPRPIQTAAAASATAPAASATTASTATAAPTEPKATQVAEALPSAAATNTPPSTATSQAIAAASAPTVPSVSPPVPPPAQQIGGPGRYLPFLALLLVLLAGIGVTMWRRR